MLILFSFHRKIVVLLTLNFVLRFSLLLFLHKIAVVYSKLLLQFCSDQTRSFFVRKLKAVQNALHGPIFYFHPAFSCKKSFVIWQNWHFLIVKILHFPFLSWAQNKKIGPCSALLTTFIFILTSLRDWSVQNCGRKMETTNCPDPGDDSLISPDHYNIV